MRQTTAAALPFSIRLGGPHPARFGVGRRWLLGLAAPSSRQWSEDARLFAGTWAGGFLAFSLFLA